MPSVDEFNQLPDQAAREALGPCCSSGRWVKAVVAGRPYPDIGALLDASNEAVAGLVQRDLAEALAGHPRIGDRRVTSNGKVGIGGGWSSQEQAGVSRADDALRQALAEGNEDYERRFGHIYLACATGKDAAELLAILRRRLGNDPAAEWRVVAAELAKINQIRLRKLVGATP
jgi:2-oxo-4-hydroxy-4-carboxy-5-ureidoimidazoline decarboxylase